VAREAVAQLQTNGTLPGAFGAGVATEVGRGRPLSEALARFPDEVPAEDVALLEAGETTGNLDRTLDGLALRHEARRSARRRFFTDSLYPLILFHLAALLTPLPPAVKKDGRVFGPSWLFTMLAILVPFYVLLAAVLLARRTAQGRTILRRVVETVPGFGNAARHRRRADFTEVLAAAYEAGVPLDRAVTLAGRAVGDPRLEAASRDVAGGRTLHDALAGTAFLPAPLLSRISVGEKSGDLGKMLEGIAREEAETAEHVHRRSTVIAAKALYLAVAAWIVFYYVSTVLGIYGNLPF
jgi:type II secretory pathway component PulF